MANSEALQILFLATTLGGACGGVTNALNGAAFDNPSLETKSGVRKALKSFFKGIIQSRGEVAVGTAAGAVFGFACAVPLSILVHFLNKK